MEDWKYLFAVTRGAFRTRSNKCNGPFMQNYFDSF